MKKFYRQLVTNILLTLIVFLGSLWIHEGHILQEIKLFFIPALFYYGFHILVSMLFGKYEYRKRYSITQLYNTPHFSTTGIGY